jgi:hypothetical protein
VATPGNHARGGRITFFSMEVLMETNMGQQCTHGEFPLNCYMFILNSISIDDTGGYFYIYF